MTAPTPDDQAESDHEDEIAAGLFGEMLEASEAEDCCAGCVALSLFIGLTRFLIDMGQTAEELRTVVAEVAAEDDGGSVH